MKRRKWNAHTNAMIVIEGLKGKPVAELCHAHQISQCLYDQWRDQFLAQAAKAFEDPQRTRHEARLQRLMREHHLLVPPQLQLKAKRTPTGRTPQPTKLNAWWGIEMTKVLVEGLGWIDIAVVLDWSTKTIVVHDAGLRCPAHHGLQAIDMAVNRQFPQGARGQGRSLMRANGYQPTATALMQACRLLGIEPACTSDHNPKGNADTERMMRTLNAEGLWLPAWTCPVTVARAFESWIAGDNAHDLHSALGYKSPRQVEREYHRSHSTPFVAA